MKNTTKNTNKVNANIEIQTQMVFVFKSELEVETEIEEVEENEDEDKQEIDERYEEASRNLIRYEIEDYEQRLISLKCEIDNYNFYICKITGETFKRLTNWVCGSRLNIRNVDEAKAKVKTMMRTIELYENKVKFLKSELK